MKPITFECPHCHEPIAGDESMYVKELIRTEYRAARQREGVHPTEFMQSA